MKYDTIPDELKNRPRWVCVKRNSKIPMQAKQNKAASSSDPATWSDFETASAAVRSGKYDYLGFVFNGDGLVGVDIDRGFEENGFLSALSVDCMRACKSFTEKSRSGRGIHIYLQGTLPFKGQNNGEGVEIYSSGRYFIVTGEKCVYGELVENQEAIDYIVEKYFPERVRSGGDARGSSIWSPTYTPILENGVIQIKTVYPEIRPGSRNISLTSYAGQLHAQGYTARQIYSELLNANKISCRPPLGADEIQSIVKSVIRYER